MDLPDLLDLISLCVEHLLVLRLRLNLLLDVWLVAFIPQRFVVNAAFEGLTPLQAGRLLVLSDALELADHAQRAFVLLQHLVKCVELRYGEVFGGLLLGDTNALASPSDCAHLDFLVWPDALVCYDRVQLD